VANKAMYRPGDTMICPGALNARPCGGIGIDKLRLPGLVPCIGQNACPHLTSRADMGTVSMKTLIAKTQKRQGRKSLGIISFIGGASRF